MEFQRSIIEDLELLGIKGDVVTFSSNYFDKMYGLAVDMIKEGKAYADDTLVDQMRQERSDGIPSTRRDRSIEENLSIFQQMLDGTDEVRYHSNIRTTMRMLILVGSEKLHQG